MTSFSFSMDETQTTSQKQIRGPLSVSGRLGLLYIEREIARFAYVQRSCLKTVYLDPPEVCIWVWQYGNGYMGVAIGIYPGTGISPFHIHQQKI